MKTPEQVTDNPPSPADPPGCLATQCQATLLIPQPPHPRVESGTEQEASPGPPRSPSLLLRGPAERQLGSEALGHSAAGGCREVSYLGAWLALEAQEGSGDTLGSAPFEPLAQPLVVVNV